MFNTETEFKRWNTLQEPVRVSQVPAAYLHMLSALDNGWQILEPVCIQISSSHFHPILFQVCLTRSSDGAQVQMTVHDCPEIEQFIRSERIRVTIAQNGNSSRFAILSV